MERIRLTVQGLACLPSMGLLGPCYPDPHEVYIDIRAEGSFELSAHLPTIGRVVFVKVEGKIELRTIACRQKTDLVEHSGEAAHRVGAPRKTEEADLVTFAVVLHEEPIRIFDVNT